jgi:hypothetical protein
VGEHDRFIEKFFAIHEVRARHVPVSPDHRRERPFALGNNEIRRHTTALGAGIRDVVDRDLAALFDSRFLYIERSFLVVIEVAKEIGTLWQNRPDQAKKERGNEVCQFANDG